MAGNWDINTRYPPATPTRNHFPPAINLNFSEATYGPIQPQNRTYNMLKNMANYSSQLPSEHAENFLHDGTYLIESIELLTAQVVALSSQVAAMNDGGRTRIGAAACFNGNMSSMDEARFINNGIYAGYRGNYSNHYHPNLHNHENFLYASYSDEKKPSLEELLGEFANESKRMEAPIDEVKPSLEDLFAVFATNTSKRMDYNDQRLDDLELHMSNLGATLQNFSSQVCQIATAVNARSRENFVDDDDEGIESMPIYEEPIQSEQEIGRNGKEERYTFVDNIFTLSYQHHTQLFESQINKDLEILKILPTNNCCVEINVAAQEEDLKRKKIDTLDKWHFNEQEPPGMEIWASVARGQHEDLSTMGWSIDNIIGETPIVEVDGLQCKKRVLPKYTRYFDPP